MDEDDGLLSRWSRRKRQVAEEAAPVPPAASAPEPVEIAEPESEDDEARLLEELGLPRPESLKEGDDFTVFMKAGVPEFLRKRALRVLWRSNPVLAVLDGLNDYDEDFTSPEMTQKVLATAYKVGRGFVREIAEPEADDADVEEAVLVRPVVVEAVTEDSLDAQGAEIESQESDPAPEDAPAFRPRRMRFET